jgi:hypothetical protein
MKHKCLSLYFFIVGGICVFILFAMIFFIKGNSPEIIFFRMIMIVIFGIVSGMCFLMGGLCRKDDGGNS